MKYRHTCVLLPCDRLEDFPLHVSGDDADGLLAAWTALWHPTLLAQTGSAPHWFRGDSPPPDLADHLIVAPDVSLKEIPTGFAQRAAEQGAWYVPGNHCRDEILRRAFEPLTEPPPPLDPHLVADFLALGYCFLQVELLTRQMRYSTNLDEIQFFHQVVEGAKAVVAGDESEARRRLTACFDLLARERDHYYAVDVYVIDIVLLVEQTLGDVLVSQLDAKLPVNLLLAGQLLPPLRDDHPASFAALLRGLDEGHIGLIGGDLMEQRSPLLGCETMLDQLRRGLSAYEDTLGRRPHVYGRRRHGLTVLHPQLLCRLGYRGVLHMAFDGGRMPEGTHRKIRWRGPDDSALDTLLRAPLDAARPETFLALARKLKETMDADHVATLCLAHWPRHCSPWYDDLRRVARYGNLLGRFITAEDYFRDTDFPGHYETFQADQYQSPYLVESTESREIDPISTSVRYWRRHSLAAAIQAAETMVTLVTERVPPEQSPAWCKGIDASADVPDGADWDATLVAAARQTVRQVAELVPRAPDRVDPGYLVVNPCSFVRRLPLDLPRLSSLPAIEPPVYAAADDGEHRYVVADVPPMGFTWIRGGPPAAPPGPAVPLAEPYRLRNEFLEARINPSTGSLQSVQEYEKRGNFISQQVAMRMSRSADRRASRYSTMVADRVEVTAATTVMGEITAHGRLLDQDDAVVARFRQRYRLWRGSRVLHLSIHLEPLAAVHGNPWNCYYACRFAWAHDTARLWRAVNQLRQRAEAKRFEAPNYVLIEEDHRSVTILTGGLPFHRRTDPRMLDSLLIVPHERQREFELGIGINVRDPLQESIAFLTPPATVHQVAGAPAVGAASWLLHLDRRNVLVTSWAPLVGAGGVGGFLVRLMETAGRATRARMESFRPIRSVRILDFRGESLGACEIDHGGVVVDLKAHQWTQLEASW